MKTLNRVSVVAVSCAISFMMPMMALADDNLTPVNFGAAGNFVILAKAGISTTGSTYIVGDIGVSPASATSITGFSLILPASGTFSTSSLVNGRVYAPGYMNPTPVTLSQAILDMQNAYTDLAGRDPDVTELGAGNIGGMTLTPGVYQWSTGLNISTDVTLSGTGDPGDMWIFQVAGNLTLSSAAKVILSGGAEASNVFWVVAGQTTLGTTSLFNGNILDQTAIVLNTGARLNGRALAQTAVTLDSNSVTSPTTPGVAASTPTPTGVSTSSNSSTGLNNPSVYPTAATNSATTNMAGCASTSGFSVLSGQPCSNTTTTVNTTASVMIPGCNGTIGFSITTGKPCTNNTSVASLNAAGNTGARVVYDFGPITLRSGSYGNAVMELQRFLNARLGLGLVVDGKLGPKTIVVIKKWQKDHGLVADGLIGVKTKLQMNAESAQ